MAFKFSCGFIPLILLIFRLVITYFGTSQIAPGHTISQKFSGGNMPPTPLVTVFVHNYMGHIHACYFYYLFWFLAIFKTFEKFLSDILT